jgi:phosphoribosylaminoimidazole-succinocarboxamide synthase
MKQIADHLILVFRDDASAFNGEKIEQLDRKGKVNNRFNAFIMENLLKLVLKLILKNCFLQQKFL